MPHRVSAWSRSAASAVPSRLLQRRAVTHAFAPHRPRTKAKPSVAAAKAGLSTASGYRIEADLRLPSAAKRTVRGRRPPDPLAGIFEEEVVPLLQRTPPQRANDLRGTSAPALDLWPVPGLLGDMGQVVGIDADKVAAHQPRLEAREVPLRGRGAAPPRYRPPADHRSIANSFINAQLSTAEIVRWPATLNIGVTIRMRMRD